MMSDRTLSAYREEETPSVDLSSEAVIIVGISFLSINCWWGEREHPPHHD